MAERYYNVRHAAEQIGRTEKAMRKLIERGQAPRFVKLHGRVVVSETDLELWIREGLEDV